MRDTDLKDKVGKQFREAQSDLINFKQELETIQIKLEASSSNEKLLENLRKPENLYESRMAFINFLRSLPFNEQQRIVEAIISPESGGRVQVQYPRPTDDALSPEEMEKDKIDVGEILSDREPIPSLEFIFDMSKIKSLISGLNKQKLNKFYSSGVAGRPYRLD
jgi:hypothetical protein